MKKGNIVASALCILLGTSIVIICLGYPKAESYGTGAPGPGLWPGLIAVGLVLVGIWLLISTLRAPEETMEKITLFGEGQKRVYLSMLILILYTFLLPTIGFIPVTVLMLYFFIQWFAKYNWYLSLSIAVIVTVGVYLVFKFVLSVPIDFGMISF